MTVTLRIGDCRDVLRTLPDESVHCVVTSPPYWGLRDYGVAGQLGLEENFATYATIMVDVFREVRRVLRKDGTLWLNLGDSYANNWNGGGGGASSSTLGINDGKPGRGIKQWNENVRGRKYVPLGLKPKDLCGIPWRIAFALQEDGWYLRQDIIWSKPNPMPESVTDRCTKAHEYLFLLAKSERYFYDADAIKEEAAPYRATNYEYTEPSASGGLRGTGGFKDWRPDNGRNKRSVWEIATQPFSEAHFATFPPALIEPCIKAGCPIGGTVLDPFAGAGTTGLVADRLQRSAILIELKPEYAAMAERRIMNDAPLFAQVDAYNATDDFAKSIDESYRVIRERKAAGGKGWEPP